MYTIGQLCGSRENNFDFIRFALAVLVIYTHSYDLTGRSLNEGELVFRFTRQQLPASGMAVDLFFVISGFLVSLSWVRTGSLYAFASKRIRRIAPGFAVTVLFCMMVIGPISTSNIQGYFTNPTTYRFATLLCLKGPQDVAEAFQHNAVPGNMDGSLWTIRLELICYVLIAVFGVAGVLQNRWALAAFLVLCATGDFYLKELRFMASAPLAVREFPPMLLHFAVGMAFFAWRNFIKLSWWWAGLCVLGLALSCAAGGLRYTFPFLSSYLLFYIAFSRTVRIYHFASRADLSYGVYLYAFPVQQLMVQFLPWISPLLLWAGSSIASSGLAFLSWTLVESPWLTRKAPSRASTVVVDSLSQA